jgi:ABC-2 type transport system permease protein
MNTQSNIPESAPTPQTVSTPRPLYWSVRRELWGNRSIYLAPLIVAGVLLFGFLLSAVHVVERMRAALALDPAEQGAAIAMPYDVVAILLIFTTVIVGVFYCLEALHGERSDRSILFWKSLPVSDFTTVLAKASIPMVILPLVAFVVIVVTQLIILLLNTVVLAASDVGAAALWAQLPMVRMSLVLLYGLVTIALWYAPIYGWLLLVSAWAQRTTFLWALLPPLAVAIVERIAFGTTYFGSMLKYRLSGSFEQAFTVRPQAAILVPGDGTVDAPHHHQMHVPDAIPDPMNFLSTPGLWIGLAFAIAFLAAVIWLRRYREAL